VCSCGRLSVSIVNWKNAPAYKLAKMLVKKDTHIPLPYMFNVENTVQLMNNLTDLPYDRNIKFASLDINCRYSNIPNKEMITTLGKLCEIHDIEDITKQDILKITQVIVEQNYFCFQDMIYIQNEGLAMGAPTSSIFSEIYLQDLENAEITEVLSKHKVEGYFRYVDILIMYKEDQTNIHNMLDEVHIRERRK